MWFHDAFQPMCAEGRVYQRVSTCFYKALLNIMVILEKIAQVTKSSSIASGCLIFIILIIEHCAFEGLRLVFQVLLSHLH